MRSGNKKKLLDQPPQILRRWFAIKIIRGLRPHIEGAARYFLRIKLVIRERKRSAALTDALNATTENFKKSKSTKHFELLKIFFNLSLFFLLAEKDIQSVKIDALTHPDEWKRNLSLRIILLVIHEWDMAKVAPAKQLKEAYRIAGISEDLIKEMNVAFREINKAHARAKILLSPARHATIAHRDADAMLQYEMIMKIDTLSTMEIASSFYEGADLFVKALPKVMLEASSTQSLIKQFRV
ncbi:MULTISPECIES: hypothetical protein [Pseudomonas syringae group]|uniref:Uncharacterized protein n=3 Tax=Pseudomonas syringae group TaxID=136849 RepID=A0A3M2WML9_PSEA0|nr:MULTISPECIES: hypothetical protein [Pseudomonas syringae group]EGH08605.1 hypothetical protein PSYMP_07193 [Pseudomonas amygdali pv. morsprunorum str. M302280]KWS61879.1 hypothetical protein AL055_27520 [Pseudomonas amygdali pv. morsprunorum]PHN35415.1 hypothetical protein AO261_01475 [Pseudomonas avellanae]POC86583.1 hypothetical protein BKM26_20420 [Pseudomonas avellanae]POD05224.1 hypothetical protein BKM20_19700 [Pseudomonas avellanae]